MEARSRLRRFKRLVFSCGFLICGLLVGAGTSRAAEDAPEGRPNFVFVLIDTLRKDHLGAYGYARSTSPFIDSLAQRGLLFERSVSQAPWTAPSMASLWTSRYPSEAGVGAVEGEDGLRNLDDNRVSRLREELPTLADWLTMSGYRTLAITGNPYSSSLYGLLRGFEEKVEYGQRQTAERVVADGIGLLSEQADGQRPFFLYLHFIDAHQPTQPPAPYDAMFETLDGKPHQEHHYNWAYHERDSDIESPAFANYLSHKLALYDGAIRYVDDQLQRVAEYLRETGQLERTIFVVASDHGEEFWDHAAFSRAVSLDPRSFAGAGHGHSLFGDVLDVPLILAGPGVPNAQVPTTVRNLDIAPTVLGLAGAKSEPSARGVDLVAALEAQELRHLDAVAQDLAFGAEGRSIQDGEFKYIEFVRSRNGAVRFLFEAGAEDRDLIDAHPERAAQLAERLREELARDAVETDAEPEVPQVDPVTREQLEQLGYGN